MLALLAATLSYGFPDVPLRYAVDVQFEGFLPILGGRTGRLDVKMGLEAKSEGAMKVGHRITELEMKLNDAKLPFGIANVSQFFPPTISDFTPQGRVLKSSAPEVKSPVRLPGLDVRRLAELTYLPLEFPETPLAVGDRFAFSRPFEGGAVNYAAVVESITESVATFSVEFGQRSIEWEDASLAPVQEAKAASRVETQLSGKGTATFDRVARAFRLVQIEARAEGAVTPVKGGSPSTRTLVTKLKTTLEVPKQP